MATILFSIFNCADALSAVRELAPAKPGFDTPAITAQMNDQNNADNKGNGNNVSPSDAGDNTGTDAPAANPAQPNDNDDPKPPMDDDDTNVTGSDPSTLNPTQKADIEIAKPRDDVEKLPPVEVHYGDKDLPYPVKRMRELLLEAAKTGDLQKLRPYIGSGDDVTTFSLTDIDGDPLEFLRGASGDEAGDEILAILTEVLDAGYVVMDKGTERESYVWPYFFAMSLDKLTPPQKVELFRLVTFGDFEDMKSYGVYNFYRVGISPQGRWQFFVAGE